MQFISYVETLWIIALYFHCFNRFLFSGKGVKSFIREKINQWARFLYNGRIGILSAS